MIIVYIIVGFVIIMLLLVLVLPKKYEINKSIIVNCDMSSCYNMVADLNHYKDWNPWYKMEPDAKTIIDGTPKTIGHQYTWDGKKIGVGALTITNITENKSVELELEFIKPFASKAIDKWEFEQLPNNQVKINWHNSGPLAFPIATLMGPFIIKNLNKQFEQGLNNIKAVVEKK